MDKKISELSAGTPLNTDYIPYVDGETDETKKALKSELKGETGDNATADAGSTTTLAAGESATVSNVGTTSDAVFDFGIPQGIQGEDGAKITSVAFSGNNIVFTLDDDSTVTLTDAKLDLKGEQGDVGAKITGASFVGDDMVFTLDDSSTVTLSNAKVTLKGATGAAGTITSIIKTDTTGLVDTYTVTYNDDTTTTFTVTNGADGDGSGDTMSPATNTDSYLPQWDGANSKTLKNGVALPVGGLAGLTALGGKQDTLVSGTNIKTVNSTTLLGSGNIAIPVGDVTLTGIQTLTNKTLTTPAITNPTGLDKNDVGLSNVDNTSDATKNSASATLTNKRITKRVKTFTSDATPDINSDNYDAVTITAQAVAITDVNVTGTPTNFQHLVFRIKDSGAAKSLTFGSDFEAGGVALPDTTIAGKTLLVGFIWDSVDNKWACEASSSRA